MSSYLKSQAAQRFVEVIILNTTPAQEATIQASMKKNSEGYAVLSKNCATAVASALEEAGVISNSDPSILPGQNFMNLLGLPGAQYMYIPAGGSMPAALGSFNQGN